MGFLLNHGISFNKMTQEELLLAIEEDEYSKPTLTKNEIDRLFNKVNLKRWMVKIFVLEEKTGIKFGLEQYDINNNKPKTFYKSIGKEIEFTQETLESRKKNEY